MLEQTYTQFIQPVWFIHYSISLDIYLTCSLIINKVNFNCLLSLLEYVPPPATLIEHQNQSKQTCLLDS